MFHLSHEWRRVEKVLPRVKLLPGERQRERVLTPEEEALYLAAATAMGVEAEQDYKRALTGIRAVKRGQQPHAPDAYLLRDAVTVLIDCGLRPEECYRLTWDNVRDGAIVIHTGKGKASRRRVPASARVLAFLEMRKGTGQQEVWIFPAHTTSGHIESGSLKKLHARALTLSEVTPFVLYDLRHTCLTRWAKGMDSMMLKKLAGHTSLTTTARRGENQPQPKPAASATAFEASCRRPPRR